MHVIYGACCIKRSNEKWSRWSRSWEGNDRQWKWSDGIGRASSLWKDLNEWFAWQENGRWYWHAIARRQTDKQPKLPFEMANTISIESNLSVSVSGYLWMWINVSMYWYSLLNDHHVEAPLKCSYAHIHPNQTRYWRSNNTARPSTVHGKLWKWVNLVRIRYYCISAATLRRATTRITLFKSVFFSPIFASRYTGFASRSQMAETRRRSLFLLGMPDTIGIDRRSNTSSIFFQLARVLSLSLTHLHILLMPFVQPYTYHFVVFVFVFSELHIVVFACCKFSNLINWLWLFLLLFEVSVASTTNRNNWHWWHRLIGDWWCSQSRSFAMQLVLLGVQKLCLAPFWIN